MDVDAVRVCPVAGVADVTRPAARAAALAAVKVAGEAKARGVRSERVHKPAQG